MTTSQKIATREAISELEETLCRAAQLFDGFRQFARPDGDWTEWDDDVRKRVTLALQTMPSLYLASTLALDLTERVKVLEGAGRLFLAAVSECWFKPTEKCSGEQWQRAVENFRDVLIITPTETEKKP